MIDKKTIADKGDAMKPVLETKEAANLLGVSRYMLDEMVKQNKLPKDCYFELPNIFGDGKRKRLRFLTDKILNWRVG